MSKYLKLISLLILFAFIIICLPACENNLRYDIGLILTEKSRLNDGTFNQSAFEGIELYAKNHAKHYKAYPPDSQGDEDYLKAMETAVGEGVRILVTPGFNFETSVFKAQDLYPEIRFILIDGIPNNGKFDETHEEKIAPNTCAVLFAEEQAGFFAGYAIVKDGFRKLGFIGGRAFPAVIKYGYGFIQGAEYAAKELGLAPGEVTVKYDYAGNFEPTPETQAKAASWYNIDGVEVIFACGGAMGNSVIHAAKNINDKWVIGVDNDQSGESDKVITSALKMIANAVNHAITSHYDGNFPGGQSFYMGVETDGVGLEIGNARFRSFTKEDYDKIYNLLVADQNGIRSSIIKDLNLKPTDLQCEYVRVIE